MWFLLFLYFCPMIEETPKPKETRSKQEKYNCFEYRQFTIRQTHAAMKVGTDSDLLGTLAAGGSRILDIGTGTGILSLMLAQRFPQARISAIEIDENAVLDAQENFARSVFNNRISLTHTSFQDFLENGAPEECFDSVVCNPPYFDKSLECPDLGRTRARHSSSLPFDILVKGAYQLLQPGGAFSVCITPEVLNTFISECTSCGFRIQNIFRIKTMPHKAPKRFVLVCRKNLECEIQEYEYCMRNADGSRSDWYLAQLKDFLTVEK